MKRRIIKKLIIDEDNFSFNKGLYYYILDSTPEKELIISNISKVLDLKTYTVFPEKKIDYISVREIHKCVYPPVTSWLAGFNAADFVVTDSFHGCVFSIIFNRPFIVIGNKERGLIGSILY